MVVEGHAWCLDCRERGLPRPFQYPSSLAGAGFAISLCGVFFVVLAPVGLGLSIAAVVHFHYRKRKDEPREGFVLAIAGVVLGVLGLAMAVVYLSFASRG